jgi:hypothetical protein
MSSFRPRALRELAHHRRTVRSIELIVTPNRAQLVVNSEDPFYSRLIDGTFPISGRLFPGVCGSSNWAVRIS